MAVQNWLTEKEVEDVVCKSVLVSRTTVDIINNITKNMKELLEKRGVKLLEIPKDKSLEERMLDIEKILLQKKIIWVPATEKYFDEDWMFHHYRYAADKVKLDTDLFEVRDGALMKIGGTGRLPFNEIEILVEL